MRRDRASDTASRASGTGDVAQGNHSGHPNSVGQKFRPCYPYCVPKATGTCRCAIVRACAQASENLDRVGPPSLGGV